MAALIFLFIPYRARWAAGAAIVGKVGTLRTFQAITAGSNHLLMPLDGLKLYVQRVIDVEATSSKMIVASKVWVTDKLCERLQVKRINGAWKCKSGRRIHERLEAICTSKICSTTSWHV